MSNLTHQFYKAYANQPKQLTFGMEIAVKKHNLK